MPIRVALHHRTIYHYDRLVQLSPQVVRLRPAPHCRTPVTAYSLKIEPQAALSSTGSRTRRATSWRAWSFRERVRHFSVEVDLVAEMTVINPFDFFLEPYAEKFPFRYEAALERRNWRRSAKCVRRDPSWPHISRPSIARERRTIDFLVGLNQRLQHEIRYLIRMEPGVQSSEETLDARQRLMPRQRLAAGRDSAPSWAGGALRVRLSDPVEARREAARWSARSGAGLHRPARLDGSVSARARAGLVSTRRRDCLAGEGHIPLAATPEPSSAAPVSGLRGRVRGDVRARDVE